MNKTIFSIILGLLLVLSLGLAEPITVTVNGQNILIDEAFCADEDAGVAVLGSDFYLYCESNFEEEYNAPVTTSTPTQSLPTDIVDTNNSLNDSQPISFFTVVDEVKTNKRLKTLAILLLTLIILLIGLRQRALYLHKLDSYARLQPHIRALRKQGYSAQEIKEMLERSGYDEKFIKKLFKHT